MVVTKTVCSECGTNNRSKPNYCPECGAENPWEEEAVYEFNDEDLPFIFETSITSDNWELWDDFCQSYFSSSDLTGDDIKNLPDDFPRMKYRMIDVYWVLTEDLDVDGPYLERKEARNSTSE